MNDHTLSKITALRVAVGEAKRFIVKAEAAVKRLEADDMAYLTGSKETAAARRASMDLTRSLVEVRRP